MPNKSDLLLRSMPSDDTLGRVWQMGWMVCGLGEWGSAAPEYSSGVGIHPGVAAAAAAAAPSMLAPMWSPWTPATLMSSSPTLMTCGWWSFMRPGTPPSPSPPSSPNPPSCLAIASSGMQTWGHEPVTVRLPGRAVRQATLTVPVLLRKKRSGMALTASPP